MPRPMQWVTTTREQTNIVSGAQTNLPLFTSISLPQGVVKGCTLTRMILEMNMTSESVAQLNQLYFGVVPVNADAASVGQFPEADDLADRAGWLIRGRLWNIQSDLSDPSQWTTRQYDLRAQRVFRSERDELHLIIDTPVTGFTCRVGVFVRCLIKLP